MVAPTSLHTCAQCGRPIPADPAELARWRAGDLLIAGELDDDISATLLVCPECAEDDRVRAFEEGTAD